MTLPELKYLYNKKKEIFELGLKAGLHDLTLLNEMNKIVVKIEEKFVEKSLT